MIDLVDFEAVLHVQLPIMIAVSVEALQALAFPERFFYPTSESDVRSGAIESRRQIDRKDTVVDRP